jgi:peptidyl-prolyl cis-trans isomerase D
MSSFVRRISKSKVGTMIMASVLLAILVGFALADLKNFGTGSLGFGLDSSTIAKIGNQKITDRDMREAMQRRLQQVREQKPDADYPSLAGDFDPLLAQMIDQRAIITFANKYGFPISKRLVDAEISELPGVRGLNGQPSVPGYQAFLAQNRLTDKQVRDLLSAEIVARYLMLPLSAESRVPVGVATPYASMLLEAREGEAAVVPITAFTAGLKPSDADLQRYYAANRARYTVPEQRVIRFARIGPEQVPGAAATDQEIEAYYKSQQATYGAKETRSCRDDARRADSRRLCRDRRQPGRGDSLLRPRRDGDRTGQIRLRLGRREGRIGQDRRRQIARCGALRNRGQAHCRKAQAGDRGCGRQGPGRT